MAANGFGGLLADYRRARKLTQAQLAERSGLSISAIQSYEQSRRIPDAAEVSRLATGVGSLSVEERNRLRRAAGHPPEASGLMAAYRKARGSAETVWDEVGSCEFSSLVMNERKEIVAWNALANRVGERDLGILPSQIDRSVLRMAATDHFAARLTNWDELIGRLISFLKDEGADLTQGETPPYLQAVLASIMAENPEFIQRLYGLWLSTPIWQAEWRNVHPIKWRLGDGTELAFHGAFGDWSQYDGLWSFDWHAANAATADWVQRELAVGARDVTPIQIGTLREEIAKARSEARMSRPALAQRSGVSASAIAAYESGQRAPSRPMLVALCHALTLDGYATNRLMRLAGYEEEPSDMARWLCGEEPTSVYKGKGALHGAPGPEAIFREADKFPWPCAVLDSSCHIVHMNPLARRVVEPARWGSIPGRPGPHLMQLMVSRQFRERVGNWAEVAGVVLPGRLEAQVLGARGESSSAGVRSVAEYLRKSEPQGLADLFDVWAGSSGFDSLRRPAVRFEWRTEDGDQLAFNCTFSTWNAYDPYKSMDLFPADAATFAWLERS